MLYVPAGFPHTTDTVNTAAALEANPAAAGDSVHLTIGIDTHIWGLNRLSLRSGALHRARLPDGLKPTTLPAEVRRLSTSRAIVPRRWTPRLEQGRAHPPATASRDVV